MAGHSHWKSIKHKKGAADAKRGKIFSKFAKIIMVAARSGGGNPADNLRLRYAIDQARAESMPKDSIERAIKKGTGELQGAEMAELTYEAKGPGGCSLVVEVLTDNRNRTAGEVRSIIEKRGGTMSKALWNFKRQGVIAVSPTDLTEEQVFELAIDKGADNIETVEEAVEVTTDVEHFEAVRAALQAAIQKKREKPDRKWGEAEDDRPIFLRSELIYAPLATVRVEGEKARQVLSLIEDLEEHEDVQAVHADFDIPEESLA